MPIHLQSITSIDDDSELFAALLRGALDHSDAAVVSEDKIYLQMAQFLYDTITGERIGKLVSTMFRNEAEKSLRILDIDIMLDSDHTCEMTFLEKLPPSSDANEYYEIMTVPEQQHLLIETVNRYFIKGEMKDTTQTVRACAFPFRISLYDSIDQLNEAYGIKKIKNKALVDLGFETMGFSETFTSTASMMKDSKDEVYSFLIGKINNFRDVEIRFDGHAIPFVIAQVETALGLLPTAMGRDVFDLEKLAPGGIIAMYADIKVDFAVDQ